GLLGGEIHVADRPYVSDDVHCRNGGLDRLRVQKIRLDRLGAVDIRGAVVERRHLPAFFEELAGYVSTQETGSASHQRSHLSVLPYAYAARGYREDPTCLDGVFHLGSCDSYIRPWTNASCSCRFKVVQGPRRPGDESPS